MKTTFDKALLLFWECMFFFAGLLSFILFGMLEFCIRLFFRGGRQRGMRRFLDSLAGTIRGSWRGLKRRIRDSVSFCRVMSALAFVLFLIYLYPPSSWGSWTRYENGVASYYGWGFYCRASASGEIYWPWKYAAAHRTLPMGTIVKVRNVDNGRTIYVRIFDRGPFVGGRVIDLTRRAGRDLGIADKGLAEVEIYVKE